MKKLKLKLLNNNPEEEIAPEACLTPGDGDGICGGEDTCDFIICDTICPNDICGVGILPAPY
ncbi:hypothetical protein [Thermosipho africanus]|uniref:hypothetical protein n=1 Tax=Thermosipho africanus TaxID=2421 RepID=UPI001E46F8F0|nr:hypothetical protein [Thermosipho africanus]